MTPEDAAWVAGLFEGEGCVSVHFPNKRKRPYPSVYVGMTDLDVLQKFHKTLGRGNLIGPHTRQGNRKPLYTYQLFGWNNVKWFYSETRAWLCARRSAKFQEILAQEPTHSHGILKRLHGQVADCGRSDPMAPSHQGYERHRKRKEPPCESCRKAYYLRQRAYRLRREQKTKELELLQREALASSCL